MALIELCNLDSEVNIHPFQKQNDQIELEEHTNLVNPMQLALPPLGDVRISLFVTNLFLSRLKISLSAAGQFSETIYSH